MRPRPTVFLLLLAAVAAIFALGGCGTSNDETEVMEGEHLNLGELIFDVQITRQLNPSSIEDAAYLENAPPLAKGQEYLGVFMKIENDGDGANVVPFPIKLIDTRGEIFVQAPLENDFALTPGTPILPGKSVPGLDTAARNSPIQGSLILFLIPEAATENRPLQLEIPGPGESGKIELDL